MTDITIPEEVIEAAARAIGKETYVGNKQTLRDAGHAAILAALKAWPGRKNQPSWDLMTNERKVSLILPLPQQEPRT